MSANHDRLALIEHLSSIRRRALRRSARDARPRCLRHRRRDGGRGLLALPVRSSARTTGAARDRRPRSRIGRQGFDATQRGAGRAGAGERRAGLRARRDQPCALQIFSRDRRGALPYFPRRAGARRAQEAARSAGRADAASGASSTRTKSACSALPPTRSRKFFLISGCANRSPPRKKSASNTSGG